MTTEAFNQYCVSAMDKVQKSTLTSLLAFCEKAILVDPPARTALGRLPALNVYANSPRADALTLHTLEKYAALEIGLINPAVRRIMENEHTRRVIIALYPFHHRLRIEPLYCSRIFAEAHPKSKLTYQESLAKLCIAEP